MASEHKPHDEDEPSFSFAVRELKQAQASEAQAARNLTLQRTPLRMPLKASSESGGSDPYNTSGSFDRKKNWNRVGKR